MARIPQFQRQALASEVVGTPGVDTSGADLGASLARSTNQMADVAATAAIERRQILDDTEALKQASNLELKNAQILDEHTRQYADDPTGKTDVLKQKLQQNLDNTLSGITSERVKGKVAMAGTRLVGDSTIKEVAWARDRETGIAFKNVQDVIANRAMDTYASGRTADFGRFKEIIAGTPAIVGTAHKILSPEQTMKLETFALESQVSSYIQGGLDDNPAVMAEQLKSGALDHYTDANGEFKTLLTPEKRDEYLTTAQNRMAKMVDTATYNRLSNIMSTQDDLVQKFTSDELTMADVENISDPKTQKVFKDLYEKANPLTNEEQAQVADELYSEYYKLARNHTVNEKNSAKKIKFEQLIDLRNKVYANFNNLSESQRNLFLKELIPAITDKIKRGERGKDHFSVGFADIDSWVSRVPDGGAYINGEPVTQRDAARLRTAAKNQYSAQLKESAGRKNHQGIPMSAPEVLQEVKRSFSRPEWAAYRLGETVISNNISYKIVGFDPDTGEPLTAQVK